MVLSDNGDHPMTKLSDTQAVILSAAAQRDDGAVLPLPETLKIKGGAVDKVLGSLKAKGLIEHLGAARRRPAAAGITREGMAAIGVEAGRRRGAGGRRHRPDVGRGRQCGRRPGAGHRGRRRGHAGQEQGQGEGGQGKAAKPGKAAPAEKPTPRAGTKQALMIELLRRPEGATVEQIAAATGWQHHTIRGAISGALKKKLGLTVEATRTREVGPNKTGAKGSTTVYRITGSSPRTS